MDEDQNNLNLQSNSESSAPEIKDLSQDKTPLVSESSAPEIKDLPQDKAPLEKSIEHDKEAHTNKDSSLEIKKTSRKGWLLFLALLIALGAGFYFYTNKNSEYLFNTLPQNLKKLFLTVPKIKNSLDNEFEKTPFRPTQEVLKQIEGVSSSENEPKEMTAKSPEEIIKSVEGVSSSENKPKEMAAKSPEEIIKSVEGVSSSENEPKEMVAKSPEEIIKSVEGVSSSENEPKEMVAKSPEEIGEKTQGPSPFDKIMNENEKTINLLRNEIQSLKSETKETSKKEEGESKSEAKNFPITSQSAQTNSPPQKNDSPKIYPQRSKEVQAYLNFVENSGRKFFELITTGLAHLQVFVGKLKGEYLTEY